MSTRFVAEGTGWLGMIRHRATSANDGLAAQDTGDLPSPDVSAKEYRTDMYPPLRGALVREQDNAKERDRGNGLAGHRPRPHRVPEWATHILCRTPSARGRRRSTATMSQPPFSTTDRWPQRAAETMGAQAMTVGRCCV
ncbi:hypothetical protein GCM10009548_71580 [Streptomyces malaysiensis subsp. malaysiensis]